MIDFRYHLVSIVAVFLALAIGIVLGSTELQGTTIDGLRATSRSLTSQLNAAEQERTTYANQAGASETFLKTAEQKLVTGMLSGRKLVIVTEPGASSTVVSSIETAAALAGATVTVHIALQPKFNDLSGTTRSSLNAINAELAGTDGTILTPAAATQTVYQQQAAQLIATAILGQTSGATGLTPAADQMLLDEYEQAGYLTFTGTVTDRATLAVVVTPATAATGSQDAANQVLLAVAAQFAAASTATVVAGSEAGSSPASSAISVLRGSSVSGQVSSVDDADSFVGVISTVWALADQVAGGKPNSYGISGASAVSPVPLPAVSVTPAPTTSSLPSGTPSKTPSPKATGKVKKTVKNK